VHLEPPLASNLLFYREITSLELNLETIQTLYVEYFFFVAPISCGLGASDANFFGSRRVERESPKTRRNQPELKPNGIQTAQNVFEKLQSLASKLSTL
jgi:hypothetical protein